MPIDPSEPLSVMEKKVFGADAVRHPVTGIPLERGSGALPVKQQARDHLHVIAQKEGKVVAAEVGGRLDEFEAAGGVVNMPVSPASRARGAPMEIKRRQTGE